MRNCTPLHYRIAIVFVVTVACALASPPVPADTTGITTAAAQSDALSVKAVAWSEATDQGWDIFFARAADDKWEPAVQVTHSGGLNLVPTLTATPDGTLWIFWASKNETDYYLHYTRIRDDDVEAVEMLPALLASNLAPSALTDQNGDIWLVWSGFDGVDDDIFYSRWDGSGWSPPVRVHPDNATPDIQPVLGMDADGTIWVYWKGFHDNAYLPHISVWNGSDWDSRVLSETDDDYQAQLKAQLSSLPTDWPEEMTQPDKGSAWFPDAPVQSLPIFFRRALTGDE